MSLQIKIWITMVTIIAWFDTRCLYQTVPFSKLYLNGFEDKQQTHWINNKGQEIDTCSITIKGFNKTEDSCTYGVLKEDFVTLQTNNEEEGGTINDVDGFPDVIKYDDQLQEAPRARRKWKRPFRIVSGWARHPPPPNPCNNGPCKNGGLCTRTGTYTYSCDCTGTGYYGLTCSTEIDECASNPCQNGQTCVDHLNGYTCDCTVRYNGTHCEKDCRPGPADILFLIDSSSSGKNTLNKSVDFIENFLDTLPIGPSDFQIAAITFSNNATLEFDFNDHNDNSSLRNAFRSITNKGHATYTDVALSLARDVMFNASLGARWNASKYVILVYDGMSTERTKAINIRSVLLPSSIVRVYAVGVGEQVDHIELQQIATESEYVFSPKNKDAINRLLQETSHSDCDDCKENTNTDILVLVDASSSNTITEFQQFLSAAGDLVRHVDVDNSPDIRMTIAGFGSGINNNYLFGTFTSNNDLLSAVQKITPQTSHANAEEALRHAREVTFLPSNGGRNDARKIVALISNAKWISHNSVIAEAEKLKQSGMTLVNIGVGIETDIRKLLDIVTDPYHVFLVLDGDTSNLRSISAEAVYSTCATDIFSKRI